ncbi:MAG: LTA synthase family protein, partial [Solobacterium sp.]|nr:LTA synthase family protein [Solobacterium sp.]
LYLEILLKFHTASKAWLPELFFIFLFTLLHASLLYLLTSFIPEKFRIKTNILLMILFSTLFIAIDFIYAQFKVFYDPTTILAGTADLFTHFFHATYTLVFSHNGIRKLLLYFSPIVFYALFSKRIQQIDFLPKRRLFLSLIAITSYLSAYLFIQSQPLYARPYTTEYNYATAVEDFGLFTAMRLDLEHVQKNKNITFETIEETPTPAPVIEETIEEKEEIVYVENKLDIDFKKKKENANELERQLDDYVASLTPTLTNDFTGKFEDKNLILITAEAFSAELIDPTLTPTLYRLANKGIQFTDYYQPASAGTTGGEYEILFGSLPMNGGMALKNTQYFHNQMTIASLLSKKGYTGYAFHNNDYTFYDRNITHNNLGYSEGFMGYGNGMEEYVEDHWPQSDLEMFQGTFPLYSDEEKFNVYYMTVSGHNGYSIGENYLVEKHWDRVSELPYSDIVKGYIAANLDLEDALTWLVDALEEKGIADDTLIVLSADHFPYGLDDGDSLQESTYLSELYGYAVNNYLERDHNRLIMWSASLEKEEPMIINTPTFSLDILPTLANLFGCEWDSRLFIGRDIFSTAEPLVFNTGYDWKTNQGTYLSSTGLFYPNEGIEVDEAYVERMRTIVRNKMNYAQGIEDTDYFYHLFPNE